MLEGAPNARRHRAALMAVQSLLAFPCVYSIISILVARAYNDLDFTVETPRRTMLGELTAHMIAVASSWPYNCNLLYIHSRVSVFLRTGSTSSQTYFKFMEGISKGSGLSSGMDGPDMI